MDREAALKIREGEIVRGPEMRVITVVDTPDFGVRVRCAWPAAHGQEWVDWFDAKDLEKIDG